MMMFESRPWVIFLMAAALTAVWIFGFDVHDEIFTLVYGQTPSQQRETRFVETAMEVEFPTPMDAAPLQDLCARTVFRPGLLFTCAEQHGGIGMVRNQILKCVRYAIHAGAAVVIPTMSRRSADDLADIETGDEMPLDYLLARDAFVARLAHACPGLRVYAAAAAFPAYANRTGAPRALVASQLEPGPGPGGLQYPGAWRLLFDRWLAACALRPRAAAPVHVLLGQSYLEYPVRSDGRALAREFGKVLSFSNATRALAARALWALRTGARGGRGGGMRLGLPAPPAPPSRPPLRGIDPARFLQPGAYYGAHLRLEQDAVAAWPPAAWRFSRVEDQFEQHFRHVARTGLRTVYVACGDRAVAALFAARLAQRLPGVAAVTKHDLLRGAARRQLDAMTFDQQALVDFLMLAKASAFMGVAHSSFAWTIALRRHEMSAYPAFANNGSDLLSDEYSVIMGMEADYHHVDPFAHALWP